MSLLDRLRTRGGKAAGVIVSTLAAVLVASCVGCASGLADDVLGSVAGIGGTASAPASVGGAAPAEVALVAEYQRQLLDRLDQLDDLADAVRHQRDLVEALRWELESAGEDADAAAVLMTAQAAEIERLQAELAAAVERLESIQAALVPPPADD